MKIENTNTEDNPAGLIRLSVVVPARNEEHNIKHCLQAICGQDVFRPEGADGLAARGEIIVIDSGSTDQTPAIVKGFSASPNPAVKLVQIPPGEFGHGKTRNLGASMGRGQYIVFLNADALPADGQWLSHLLRPLREDETIAGVFSRHLPKPGCHRYMARDLHSAMPPDPRQRIRTQKDRLDYMIFSTVGCAIRRSCWERFPFRKDILIAEDQQWAEDVLAQGLKIAYEPKSRVFHSHNYTPRELFRIKTAVGRSVNRFKHPFTAYTLGLVMALGGMTVKTIGDMVHILFGPASSPPRRSKLREIKIAVMARIVGFAGRYNGMIKKA